MVLTSPSKTCTCKVCMLSLFTFSKVSSLYAIEIGHEHGPVHVVAHVPSDHQVGLKVRLESSHLCQA